MLRHSPWDMFCVETKMHCEIYHCKVIATSLGFELEATPHHQKYAFQTFALPTTQRMSQNNDGLARMELRSTQPHKCLDMLCGTTFVLGNVHHTKPIIMIVPFLYSLLWHVTHHMTCNLLMMWHYNMYNKVVWTSLFVVNSKVYQETKCWCLGGAKLSIMQSSQSYSFWLKDVHT